MTQSFIEAIWIVEMLSSSNKNSPARKSSGAFSFICGENFAGLGFVGLRLNFASSAKWFQGCGAYLTLELHFADVALHHCPLCFKLPQKTRKLTLPKIKYP
jgi:hypothetical protein